MVNCQICNKSHSSSKTLTRHLRTKHNIGGYTICCVRTKAVLTQEQHLKRKWVKCQLCEKEFLKDREKRFCSTTCAVAVVNVKGRIASEETKKKISDRLKGTTVEKVLHTSCEGCNKSFYATPNAKFCTRECYRLSKLVQPENRKPTGGYRARAGKGHHGYYNGIWCDSTYEMAYVWYCQNNDKNIIRNTSSFPYINSEGKKKKYIPDFIVDGTYIEVKGWMRPDDPYKIEQFPYKIELLIGKPIEEIVKKAKINFQTNNLSTLYSEKKTELKICDYCSLNFPKKGPKRFCNNTCSALHRTHGPLENPDVHNMVAPVGISPTSTD
jgi:hypothetical protein